MVGLVGSLNAQTNVVGTSNVVESAKSESFVKEFTFGGYGSSVNGENEVGVDVSFSTNPFKTLSKLWVGVAQGVYWAPTFGGSTDFNVNWSTHLFKELYINTGWSVGGVYDAVSFAGRTGPEVTFQYYLGSNSFIYAGANYDISKDTSGFRYSFGMGMTF